MPPLGWNSYFGNPMHQSNNHPQPRRFYPLFCRLCNKAFVTDQAILNHYRAHLDQLVSRPREENARSNLYRLNPTNSLTTTQSLSFFLNTQQMPNHGQMLRLCPTTTSNHVNSSSRPMSISSSTTDLRNKRKVQPQVQPSRAYENGSNQAKRTRESAETSRKTQWYLGKLEIFAPEIINLEEEHEYEDLDLSLKL